MRVDRIKLTTELLRQDLSQKKLAELAGISRATISSIKAGKSCSEEVGYKIAQALHVELTEIME